MQKALLYYRFYGLKKRLFLLIVFLLSLPGFAQSKEALYSFKWKATPVQQVFQQIEQESGLRFSYNPLDIDLSRKLDLEISNQRIEKILSIVSEKIDIKCLIKGEIVMVQALKKEPFVLKGLVVDNKQVPLSGVPIYNATSKKGTSTDASGKFSISAENGDQIIFKFIGFVSQTITANATQNNITVVLLDDVKKLDETVVTALGIKREQKALSYAYSEVQGNELKKARETNVINSLAGRVPGLVVNSTAGGPAGSSRVIIRGNTSITGNNQPLYVVDGMPIDNSNYGQVGSDKFSGGVDMGDAISAINPDDIDKISVLKGPSASALYGSRAANGVILITTKKGSASKELGVEFNSSSTFENQLTSFDGYQYQYGQGTKQNIAQDASQARTTLFSNFGPRLDASLSAPSFDGVNRPYALVKDNISGFFRTGSTFTNTISLTNSAEKSSFRFSASNLTNNDIVPGSEMKRNSFTFNGNSQFGSKLNLEARAFYMNEKVTNRPAMADDPSNIGNSFVGLANNVDQAQFSTGYKDELGNYVDWGGGQYRINPYWVINEMENTTKKDRILGALQANYTFTKWLSLQGRASTDITFLDYGKYSPKTTPGALSGRLDKRDQRYSTTEADLLLSFQHQVTKDINLSARLGGSLSRINSYGTTTVYSNMTMTDVVSGNSFAEDFPVEVPYEKNTNSFYLVASGAYKNFLYLDATVRRDASSTLPEDNNTYYYPSVGASFVFTDAFKLNNNIISFGKVRASAAEVGNDTDPYQLDLYYSLNPITINGNSGGGISSSVLPNKDLKPTRTRSYEFGTELKFLKNRLGVDFTYYNSESRDQINRVPAPISSGFTYQIINAGVISNKGVELLLTGKPVVSKNFNWDIGFNFARNVNNVESLAEGVPFLTLSDARWMGVSVVAMPGVPYGSILAYDYQKDPSGNIILDPVTLTPATSNERHLVGKGAFSWTGGLINTFNYKNFALNAVVDIKQGADLFSMTNLFAAIRGSLSSTLEGRAEWIESEEKRMSAGKTPDEWKAMGNVKGYVPKGVVQTGTDSNGNPVYSQNTQAVDPSVYWGQIYTDGNGVARPYIYDATYVKMRELSLSYSLPASLLSKWKVKSLAVALVSRNPFIIYKNVPNVDPDSNYNNGNGQGFEYGSLPSRRSWGINLNLRF
ncbi:SusC/RagA family TonB-linked outer membrane protein [Solitalea sp. MAHUQ-68]|uniref:SusC/RagA family TonB-linked outer membrane protein n=1 Tax=Solitalea agri TaxID=2953739 RepID=A0A9X2JE27_9SPHI|nr:SusC/RagA family TonB-linked outer membrane protein [Solitalea agri]MCO4294294.1 SusC/RagA family TonB-linked outer membrane protein [Solitalea agri]